MVRFDGRTLVVALVALLPACGRESRQPQRPAAGPSPAVQPAAPSAPPAADPNAEPRKAPKDSGGGGPTYPWQSGPIAAL